MSAWARDGHPLTRARVRPEWVQRHPGGAEAVIVGAGRECTNLIKSYHPFSGNPETVLQKMLVRACHRRRCVRDPPHGPFAQIGTVCDQEFVEYSEDKRGEW